ncbi:MAG TPA: deoxyribonuclease IV [Fimbriimonadales bacterium]|nr:deoxyribonuclease IV [Fimbriimonadales bacterium]
MIRLIGAHIPTGGVLHKALYRGKEIGCTAVQIFTSNPQSWAERKLTKEDIKLFEEAKEKTGIRALFSHCAYLINPASPDRELRKKSILALEKEMNRCAALGIPYTITHLGAHSGVGEEVGLKNVAESIERILDETPDSVGLIMENTAGSGSTIGYRFEHLAKILEANKGHKRLKVCIDTCHLFCAGYEIRHEESYEKVLKEFDKIIGLELLKVIHANDSKYPFASRKDRHEHIGKGYIGDDVFRRMINDPRLFHAPMIIETPDTEKMDKMNLNRLRSFLKKGIK